MTHDKETLKDRAEMWLLIHGVEGVEVVTKRAMGGFAIAVELRRGRVVVHDLVVNHSSLGEVMEDLMARLPSDTVEQEVAGPVPAARLRRYYARGASIPVLQQLVGDEWQAVPDHFEVL